MAETSQGASQGVLDDWDEFFISTPLGKSQDGYQTVVKVNEFGNTAGFLSPMEACFVTEQDLKSFDPGKVVWPQDVRSKLAINQTLKIL